MKNKNVAFYCFYPALQMLIANKSLSNGIIHGGCKPPKAYVASTKEGSNE
ncbi:MAG: hypothetical protein ACU833_13160 [Gammaproteobacteria bacterium]